MERNEGAIERAADLLEFWFQCAESGFSPPESLKSCGDSALFPMESKHIEPTAGVLAKRPKQEELILGLSDETAIDEERDLVVPGRILKAGVTVSFYESQAFVEKADSLFRLALITCVETHLHQNSACEVELFALHAQPEDLQQSRRG